MATGYLEVDGAMLRESVERLRLRIAERFPSAGLAKVAATVAEVAKQAAARAAAARRPNVALRIAVGLLLSIMVVGLAKGAMALRVRDDDVRNATTFAQFFQATLASVVMLGGAAAYLVNLEARLRRRKVLAAVHELRALAHIIDMHQLTKTPDCFLPDAKPTAHSPALKYTPYELGRYLDYCAELLAMVGKVGVVYSAGSVDPVTLEAVDQIEDLTTGLSRKVWQKLALLNEIAGPRGPTPPASASS